MRNKFLIMCVFVLLVIFSTSVYAETNLTDFYGWSLNGVMTWFNGSDNYSQVNIPMPAGVNCYKIETIRDGSALCIDRTYDNLIFINKSNSFNYSLIPTGDDPLSMCLDRDENVFVGSRGDNRFNFHNKSLGWYNFSAYVQDGVESNSGMCAYDLTDKYWLGGTAGDGMCYRTRDNFSKATCFDFDASCDGREMNVDGNNSLWVTCGDASKIIHFIPKTINATNYTKTVFGGYDEPVGIVPNLQNDILFVDYGNGGNGNQGTEYLYIMNATDNSSVINRSVHFECYGVDVAVNGDAIVSNYNTVAGYIEFFNKSSNYSKTFVPAPARTRNIAFATFRPDWYVNITGEVNDTNVTVNDTISPIVTIDTNISTLYINGTCIDAHSNISDVWASDLLFVNDCSYDAYCLRWTGSVSFDGTLTVYCNDTSNNVGNLSNDVLVDIISPFCTGVSSSTVHHGNGYSLNVYCSDDINLTYFNVACVSHNISVTDTGMDINKSFAHNFTGLNDTFVCEYLISDGFRNVSYTQTITVTDPLANFGRYSWDRCPVDDGLASVIMLFVIGLFLFGLWVVGEVFIKFPVFQMLIGLGIIFFGIAIYSCSAFLSLIFMIVGGMAIIYEFMR